MLTTWWPPPWQWSLSKQFTGGGTTLLLLYETQGVQSLFVSSCAVLSKEYVDLANDAFNCYQAVLMSASDG